MSRLTHRHRIEERLKLFTNSLEWHRRDFWERASHPWNFVVFGCRRMRRASALYVALGVFTLIIGLFMGLHLQDAAAADPAKDAKTARPAQTIRVGVLSHFPPHYQTNKRTDKPEGFAVDVMNAVAERAGVSVVYVVFPGWPEVNAALRQGAIDVIPSIGITEGRAEWTAFTAPVETSPVSIFTRAATHDIENADDLKERRVSVRKENVGVSLMRKRGDVDLVIHDTWEQGLLALLSGESDAFVYPKNVLLHLAREAHLDEQIKAVEPPLLEIKRAIGVRPDRPELLTRLDAAVRQFVATPAYREIFTKWYGRLQPFWTADRLLKVMAGFLVLALIAIAVIAIWRNRSLVRINARLTDAVSAREAVAATLRLHDRAIEFSSNGILITDAQAPDNPIIYANPAYEGITQFSKEEIIGRNPRFLQSDDRDQADLEKIRTALRQHRPVRAVLRNYRKDGTLFWNEINISPVHDRDGNVTHHIGIQNDISDRIASESSIRSNRAQLQMMIATSPDAIITITAEGIIESFNAAAEAKFGYTPDDVIGKNVNILMPQPYQDEHDAYLRRYLRTGEKRIIGVGREVQGRRKDGTIFPIELAVGELEIDGHRRFTGFIRDISKRLHAEEELLASQERFNELQSDFTHVSRLSAMGEMASTLAHELNQPLTAMMNYAQASRRIMQSQNSEASTRVGELMTKAVEQAHRAGEIIRRLRSFVARGETERMYEDINEVVDEACALVLVGAHSDGVNVSMDLDEDLPPVMLDRVQVQQVIVNLIRNSLDATIEQSDRGILVQTTNGADDCVQVSISDNGPGLDTAIAEKLFQPFNTSKADGMGIGLSVSRTIIEQHGGHIWATPNGGGGVTFRFTLPISE